MGRTLAIHWAQTTHGTWLHGDERGSWHDGRLIRPDPALETASLDSMVDDAVWLEDAEREIVADEFGKIVRECSIRLFAATIQATHFHLVLAPLRENIKTVVARVKYRSANTVLARRRTLASEGGPAETAGLYSRAVPARRPSIPKSLWTAGRFPVFIFDEQHLANAIEYVRDHNRRHGMSADPYPWIEPLYPPGERQGERTTRTTICEHLPW